jgi:heat shock protein HtpX
MAVVGVLTPLVVIAGLALVIAFAPWELIGVVFMALVIGAVVAMRERVAVSSRGRRVSPADAPELHAIVERLCVVADLPKPAIVLDRGSLPNSWIEGTSRGGYRLHLTRGLLDLLEPRELEAVIAHELAHVANRDAAVMTLVGGPGEALLAGGVRVAGHGWWPLMLGGAIAAIIGWAGTLGTRALSRYREYAADAGAVSLTGSPAALASALIKVSDGLVTIASKDLRVAGVSDAFHLLPARDRAFMLPATHPPLRARIERLEKLERELQRRTA